MAPSFTVDSKVPLKDALEQPWNMREELWVMSTRSSSAPADLIVAHELLHISQTAAAEGRTLTENDYARRSEEVRYWVQQQDPATKMLLSNEDARGMLLAVDLSQAAASELKVFATITGMLAAGNRYLIDTYRNTPDFEARGSYRLAQHQRNMAYDAIADETWRELWRQAETDPALRAAMNAEVSHLRCPAGSESMDCIPEEVNEELGRTAIIDTLSAIAEQGELTDEKLQQLQDAIARLNQAMADEAEKQREDLAAIEGMTMGLEAQGEEYEEQITNLAVGQSKILKFAKYMRPAKSAELEEMRRRQVTDLQLRAFESGVFIFSTLVGQITKDPRIGKAFQVIGSAQVQMLRSVSEFVNTTSKLSKLAGGIVLSGNMLAGGLSIAQTLMSMDEPDPYGIIMEQLNQISKQIQELHKTVNARFDRVDARLGDISDKLDANFGKLLAAFEKDSYDVSEVHTGLLSLHEDHIGMELRLRESSRFSIRTPLWSVQQNELSEKELTYDKFKATEKKLYDYVTITAFHPDLSAEWSDDGSMPDLLAADSGPEYYMQGLSSYPSERGNLARLSEHQMPNPIDWTSAAATYARLREKWPEHARAVEDEYEHGRDRLETVITKGRRLHEALSRVTQSELWEVLAEDYKTALKDAVTVLNAFPASDASPLLGDHLKALDLWNTHYRNYTPVVAANALRKYAKRTEDEIAGVRWYLPRCDGEDDILLPNYENVLKDLDECGMTEECLNETPISNSLIRDFVDIFQRMPAHTVSYKDRNSPRRDPDP